MSTVPPAAPRRVVVFSPWIKFRATPFDMCGIRVMGFEDTQQALGAQDREALWRARLPYVDHFLNEDRTPRPWNENPLFYAATPADPLREPPEQEREVIGLVNAFLYLCVFAANRVGPGGMQIYTNASDWALYVHPVHDPEYFALGARRLLGRLSHGGFRWNYSVISMPMECTHYELYDAVIDRSFVNGVTALHGRGRAALYVSPVRTFMLGTADNHLWRREEDLPLIWASVEQLNESEGFETCEVGQRERAAAAAALRLQPTHTVSLIRAVVGPPPSAEYVWDGDFRPDRRGGATAPTRARRDGVQFSVLERALDELNFARNRILHGGQRPALEWDVATLALLGAKFFVLLMKRILAWEEVRPWTDADACEAIGLYAFARDGRASLVDGYQAYERAVEECRRARQRQRMVEEFERGAA
jgi:hypothetical protein